MSEVPAVINANAHTVTLSLSPKPTPNELIKNMAEVAKFLTKMAVRILDDHDGPAMVSPANPAPNAMLQSAATLEQGAIQFDMLIKQQGGMIAPNGPQAMPRRMN